MTRFLFALLMGCTLIQSAHAADRVKVRAGSHRDFGRLVFEWSQPSGFEARISNDVLTVQFDRSFDASFEGAVATLVDYISEVQHNQSGTTVRFMLKGQYTLRSSHYDTSVVLDLLDNDITLSKDSARGPGVRIGEHGEFTRTVFDWWRNIRYEATRKNDQVEVSFGSSGNPDLSQFQRDPPRYIESARKRTSDDGLVVIFQVPPGTGLRHFRDGNKIVVDVLKGTALATTANRSVPAGGQKPSKASKVERINTEVLSSPKKVMTQSAPENLLPSTAYNLPIGVSTLPKGVRMVFPWNNPTAAAIFLRADYLWAVFDHAARADFSNLTAAFSNNVITAEQLANRHATILRFKVPEDRYLSAVRDELDWIVDVTETPTPPDHPLTVEREIDVHGGARIFVPALDTGNRWDLRDPEVGDILAIVPIKSPGHGMAQERLFAEFHLLPSAQGIVVQPLSEGVDVEPRRNGVRIIGENGLILSTGHLLERHGCSRPKNSRSCKRK